jgi:hypothetical protein
MYPGQHYTLLDDQSPTSGASVTFSSIPGTYDDLVLVCPALWSDKTTGNPNVSLFYNGDTTATNYWEAWRRHLAAAFSSGEANDARIARASGQNIVSPCYGEIWIPRYADSGVDIQNAKARMVSCFKTGFTTSGLQANNDWTHLWNSTATVTSLALTLDTDAWASPTRILLYGVSYSRP